MACVLLSLPLLRVSPRPDAPSYPPSLLPLTPLHPLLPLAAVADDPGNIYTEGGRLVIELTKEELEDSHNMGYLGGMLQSWNKFCFVGGYIEVCASPPFLSPRRPRAPGDDDADAHPLARSGISSGRHARDGLVACSMDDEQPRYVHLVEHRLALRPLADAAPPPAGRAGYGGSLDGTWPYVYDTCDVGTLANQTDPATGLPEFDPSEGDQYHDDDLSWLSGQRFSRCTCPEETDHPGPQYANGTWKGRCVGVVLFFAEVRASARC